MDKDRPHAGEGQDVLQQIAHKERELEQMLERTRAEAAAIIEQARREAEDVSRRAREEVAALAAEHESRAEQESRRISEEVLARARREAETLRARAAERMDAAVQLVIDRVLGAEDR